MIRQIARVRVAGDDLSVTIPGLWRTARDSIVQAKVNVTFGAISTQAQLQTLDGSKPIIIVGRPLARRLHLHEGMRLRFSYSPLQRKLTFGPILGVFTVRHPIFGGQRRGAFGHRQLLYGPLIRQARVRGILTYLFSPQDIDWATRTVLGYSLHGGKWSFARYPLPDVVYNRVPSRRDESRPDVVHANQRLKQECIYFNPAYLNKWEVHALLEKRPESRIYLPETRLLTALSDLTHFLEKYDQVYLKPTMSSVGRGIMKITRAAGGYLLHHRRGPVFAPVYYSSIAQIYRAILVMSRGRDYLVQQGIDLATYQGNHYDVRALAQKDGTGNWVVTGMAARVAAPGAIVTHVPNGGTRRPLRQVVPADRYPFVTQQLQLAGRTIPRILEEEMGALFGELSLDLAVDRTGRIWVIEVNAKPFEFDERSIRAIARQRLLDYTCFLTEGR